MKFRFLFIAILLGLSITVNAQDSDSYNRLSVGYISTSTSGESGKWSLKDYSNATLSGFGLQISHGMKIAKENPIYLEFGGRLSYSFWSDDESEDGYSYEVSAKKASLAIPVSIGYKFQISDAVSVMPYTGLHAVAHIMGKMKEELTEEGESYSRDIDCFDKNDMGGSANTWSRIQFGWQIGCDVNFDKFCVGVEYGLEFSELAKKLNTSDIFVNVGFTF